MRSEVRLGAVLLTIVVGAPIARAGSSLVPVVSDDQAEWQRERPPAYLGFGSSVSTDAYVNAELFVEGAMRVATTPVWIHGLVGSGAETQLEDQGSFFEARGGVELSCATRRTVCGFFGIDVGGEMQSRRGDKPDGNLSGVVAVPRMGLDMGGDIVRVRASVDGRWFRYRIKGDDLDGTAGGAGVSLALALRF